MDLMQRKRAYFDMYPDATEGDFLAAEKEAEKRRSLKQEMEAWRKGRTFDSLTTEGILSVSIVPSADSGAGFIHFHGEKGVIKTVTVGDGRGGTGYIRALKRGVRMLEEERVWKDNCNRHEEKIKAFMGGQADADEV